MGQMLFQIGVGALGALIAFIWNHQHRRLNQLEDRLRESEQKIVRLETLQE